MNLEAHRYLAWTCTITAWQHTHDCKSRAVAKSNVFSSEDRKATDIWPTVMLQAPKFGENDWLSDISLDRWHQMLILGAIAVCTQISRKSASSQRTARTELVVEVSHWHIQGCNGHKFVHSPFAHVSCPGTG